MSSTEGTVLCRGHAAQVVRFGNEPSGPCVPRSTWEMFGNRTGICDAVNSPERVSAYLTAMREPRAPKPAARVVEWPETCIECGSPIEQKHTGRPALYCSAKCRIAVNHRKPVTR